MSITRFLYLLAISLLFLSTSAYAQDRRILNIESRNCVHIVKFNDKCDPQTVKGTLYKPKNPTDAVVIIVHGSQGVDERHENYAKHLNSIGFAALLLDSWNLRGIDEAQ